MSTTGNRQLTERTIVAYIAKHASGVSTRSIAEDLAMNFHTVQKYAGELRAAGRIGFYGSTAHGAWATPANAATTSTWLAESLAMLAAERRRKRNGKRAAEISERYSAQHEVRPDAETEGWEDCAPVQRIVPAATAKPLGKRGPASIFEVAA